MIEQDIKNLTMIEHSMMGGRSWINNVGAAMDQRNVQVRYGLHNRTKEENRALKSSDLIGITPVVITPDMVGKTVGVFTSFETKEPGWKYTGKGRETPQNKWLNLIKKLGGIAAFISDPGQIHEATQKWKQNKA